MHVTHQETNEDQGVREAMVAVGDSGSSIQLLAPLDDSSTIARFLAGKGRGLQQLASRVTDVEQVSAALRGRGLRLLYDEPRRGTAGSRINFVHPKDTGGVLVELVEPAKRGAAASPGRRTAKASATAPANRWSTAASAHTRSRSRNQPPAIG